jgi:hypothetical protein
LNTGIQYLPVDSMHTSLQLFSQSHCDNSIRHGHYLGNNPLPQDKLAQMSREDWEKIDLWAPLPRALSKPSVLGKILYCHPPQQPFRPRPLRL